MIISPNLLFGEVKLYLTGTGSSKTLSTTNDRLYWAFIDKGDSLIWKNYFLEGDISGTNYSFYVWATSLNTILKAEIFANNILIATKTFTVNENTITQGTLYNFNGEDILTEKGDEVSLKVTNLGNNSAALSWGGSWYSYICIPNVTTGIKYETSLTLTNNFEICQNYPNPFNSSTTIKYNLQQSSYVKLNIYNNSGQVIATLVDSYMSIGEHTAKWSAEGLPSGIYFYRLNANEFSETRKLIYQK
jgi:hypothetical protein